MAVTRITGSMIAGDLLLRLAPDRRVVISGKMGREQPVPSGDAMSAERFLADHGLIDPKRPLLIHASFRALSQWGGSPADWAYELDEMLSEGGLMLPAFTGRPEDGPDDPPRFDPAETPGYTGALTEAARRLWGPGCRSLHPTHSFLCRGEASAWKDGHESSPTPCGMDSPLVRLARRGGQILLAGCGLNSLTLVHAAEEAAKAPYVLQPHPVTCWIKRDGEWQETLPIGIHSWLTPRDYNKLEPRLLDAEAMTVKELKGSAFRLIQAEPALGLLTEWITQDKTCVLKKGS